MVYVVFFDPKSIDSIVAAFEYGTHQSDNSIIPYVEDDIVSLYNFRITDTLIFIGVIPPAEICLTHNVIIISNIISDMTKIETIISKIKVIFDAKKSLSQIITDEFKQNYFRNWICDYIGDVFMAEYKLPFSKEIVATLTHKNIGQKMIDSFKTKNLLSIEEDTENRIEFGKKLIIKQSYDVHCDAKYAKACLMNLSTCSLTVWLCFSRRNPLELAYHLSKINISENVVPTFGLVASYNINTTRWEIHGIANININLGVSQRFINVKSWNTKVYFELEFEDIQQIFTSLTTPFPDLEFNKTKYSSTEEITRLNRAEDIKLGLKCYDFELKVDSKNEPAKLIETNLEEIAIIAFQSVNMVTGNKPKHIFAFTYNPDTSLMDIIHLKQDKNGDILGLHFTMILSIFKQRLLDNITLP